MSGTSRQFISIPIVKTTVLKKVAVECPFAWRRSCNAIWRNSVWTALNICGGFPYLGWSMHIQKSGSSDSTQLRACKTLKGWFGCKKSREARSTSMQASWWIENMQYRWCTAHKRYKKGTKKGKWFTYQAWWTYDLCQETCSRCNSLSCSSLVCTSPARRFPWVRWTSWHLSSVATYLVLPHLTVEGKSVFDVASPLGLVTTDGQNPMEVKTWC